MDKDNDVNEKSKRVQQEMIDFLNRMKEPSKSTNEESLPFPSVVNENRLWLSSEQNKVYGAMRGLSDLWAKKLPAKTVNEINSKHDNKIDEIIKKGDEKLITLDMENPIKGVGYWRDRVDVESSLFKKICQENERREKEMFEKLQQKQPNLNEENIEKRTPIFESYKQGIRLIRERKEEVKNQMGCNLETPSQMIDSMNNDVPPSGDADE